MGVDAGGLSRIFGESWRLLVHNPVIVVPGIVIGLVAALLEAAVAPDPGASPAAKIVDTVLADIIQLLAAVASVAFTTGMAAAAWQTGRAAFADGWAAFTRDGGQVLVALVGLLMIGTGAAFLVPFTWGLSGAAFGFFCLYVMPAAIVRERQGFAAIRESWEIAYDRVLPTLGIVFGLFAVFLAVGVIVAFLTLAPGVGPLPASIVGSLLAGAAIAYATLVIVGEYIASRRPGSVA